MLKEQSFFNSSARKNRTENCYRFCFFSISVLLSLWLLSGQAEADAVLPYKTFKTPDGNNAKKNITENAGQFPVTLFFEEEDKKYANWHAPLKPPLRMEEDAREMDESTQMMLGGVHDVPTLVKENTSRLSRQSCIKRDENGRFLGWMDYQHCIYSGRTLKAATWFDDLFGDWNDDGASMLLTAVTEQLFEEGGKNALRFRVRASVDLPNASQRFRLVVFDEDSEDSDNKILHDRKGRQSIALRWIPGQIAGLQTDFDIGVRGVAPSDIFTQLRSRRSWPVLQDYSLRFGQIFRYGSNKKGSESTQLDLERAVGNDAVFRFANMVSYEQKDSANGLSFGHGISLSHVLSAHRSLSYGISSAGRSEPNWRITDYGPWILWRGMISSSWLYYEVEPRINYARQNDWVPRASVTLRLEMQFGR